MNGTSPALRLHKSSGMTNVVPVSWLHDETSLTRICRATDQDDFYYMHPISTVH